MVEGQLVVADQGEAAEEDDVAQPLPDRVQEVLAAAITNLIVNEGITKAKVTDAQVTKATMAVKEKIRWTKKNRMDNKKKSVGGSKIHVPSILDCLKEDGSLYAEIRVGAAQTASAFLKKKTKVLAKCQLSEDTSMEEGSQSFIIRFRGDGAKRTRGSEATSQEVQQGMDGEEEQKEATSPGATGQLTGTEDRACQKP
jgi:hypothetical protein